MILLLGEKHNYSKYINLQVALLPESILIKKIKMYNYFIFHLFVYFLQSLV